MDASSSAVKKPFEGKEEVSDFYGQKSRGKSSCHQSVGALLISNPTSAQQQQ